MDILNYLQGMAVQHGPSGHEAEVSGWLKARFEALCDSVTIDPLYNVIAPEKGHRAHQGRIARAPGDAGGASGRNRPHGGGYPP